MPRGAGGMPSRLNSPSSLLPAAISRSPWNTLIVTAGWLSSAVENICANLVGIVVFFLIILVITPPSVSMPSDSGVTSSSSTSLRSPDSTWPWIAAPTATASSGLTSLRGSLPKNSLTFSCTFGMRVMPPTRITSSMSVDLDAGVLDRDAARLDGALDQLLDQRFELGARQLDVQVLRARRVGRDVRQVDVGLRRCSTARSWPSRPLPSGAAARARPCDRSTPWSFLNSAMM